MKRVLGLAVFVAACGAGGPNSDDDVVDATNPSDGASCGIQLLTFPAQPVVGDHVRVTANVFGGGGVLDYIWHLDSQIDTDYELADHSAIGFDATTATSHFVTVDISPSGGCSQGQTTITIGNPTGVIQNYRLRVVPDPTIAPPQEVVIQVHGGQSFDRPILADPGFRLQGTVKAGGSPIPAYVRFTPVLGPAFDTVTTTGNFDIHLQLQINSVMIIPQSPAYAPRVLAWMPGSGLTDFVVDAGLPIHGTVVGRTGTPLANAKVQLECVGIPSTVATTDVNGNYTVNAASWPAATAVTVTVTPPPTSGLARLTATGMFDITQSVAVSYVGSPLTCDLNGTPVKRGGANQGNAQVSIVGALGGTIGTVATGGTSVNATGQVHVNATASGGGTLPSTLVPRAPLSAVTQLANGELAMSALDTSSCAAATIDAPAMITKVGITRDNVAAPIPNVRVEATPVGDFAMGSLIPVQTTSSGGGNFSITLASGAFYELRFYDPSGRGAPLMFNNTQAGGVPAIADLAKALSITGVVSVVDYPNPVENASVQVLCMGCTGVAASRPISQTATDLTAHYRVAVPDPGM